jgi:hypothetical protein
MRARAEEPVDRPLRVFAFDPSRGRSVANVVTLRVPYEPLAAGPVGRYVAVIDYDQTTDRTYDPVNLGDLDVTLGGGLPPSEVDFHFHQQMVYAVVSRTIQAFEQAIGRPIRWPWAKQEGSSDPEDKLRIYPHGARILNCWFDPSAGSLVFGYDVVPDEQAATPGQIFYTCLAYDVVAHEAVHPMLYAVLPHAAETATEMDLSFHEGFADLIAMLQHFDFREALLDAVVRTGGRIWDLTTAPDVESGAPQALIRAEVAGTNPLLELGRQFGQALGLGGALRTALGTPPDPKAFLAMTEPHERGAVLLNAVFDALFTVYARRTHDLLVVAGVRTPRDPVRFDLAGRLAAEAAKTARQFLRMCIRALDYCPPVHVEFGDYLRAVVTSDADAEPRDEWGFRGALIESFRIRGIGAEGVVSYSEEGLRWPRGGGPLPICEGLKPSEAHTAWNAKALKAYAETHRAELGLQPRTRIHVGTPLVRTSQTVDSRGQLSREFVVQITQHLRSNWGGTTLVLDERGSPKYVIAKPLGGGASTSAITSTSASAITSSAAEPSSPGSPAAPRPPQRRPLKIFAFDPTRGRAFGNYLTVQVPYEPLSPGPVGRQVAVIDYDASNDAYYEAIDLEDPGIRIGGGLDPTDLDPRFHQQMVYAVASSTIERFEQGLARPVLWPWTGNSTAPLSDRLLIYPHAMQEANAYYDRALHGLLFGYFSASEESAGANLPGQIVHTCLSHDIVVHETTHAVLDSLRPYFLERTGVDAPAFHEAFADIIALFQHFSFPDALRETIQRTGGRIYALEFDPESAGTGAAPLIQAELSASNPLVDLARQFGEALGTRAALRSALGTPRDPEALGRLTEPHARGAVLVAAVFDAFFTVYVRRTADLMGMARAGGAITPWGDLHPDLASRLAKEATATAEQFASMCVRAIDYCPPVDVEFGDFLRAVITADFEVEPGDPLDYRGALIDAFRARGIYPRGVRSFSEAALKWQPAELPEGLRCEGLDPDLSNPDMARRNAIILRSFARSNAAHLGLSERVPIIVHRMLSRASQRLDHHGAVRPEYHVQFAQHRLEPVDPDVPDGPTFEFRGGATAVLDEWGAVRYLIGKSLDNQDRLERQRAYVQGIAGATPSAAYRGPVIEPLNLAALHRGFEG